MPTYYNFLEDDWDDIQHAIEFYIIYLGPDEYKFCASPQTLSAPILTSDPETHVEKYWPITKVQVNNAPTELLFPNDKIRNTPLSLKEIMSCFKFNPENVLQSTIGHPPIPVSIAVVFEELPVAATQRAPQTFFQPPASSQQMPKAAALPQEPDLFLKLFPENLVLYRKSIESVANIAGLSIAQMGDMYSNNRELFYRLNNLTEFVKDKRLTLEQLDALTGQEYANLCTCSPYIMGGHLSIEEAQALSEEERLLLLDPTRIKQSLAALRKFQNPATAPTCTIL